MQKNLLFRYLPSIAVITNSQTKCGNFFQIYQDKMWGEDITGTGREGSESAAKLAFKAY